MLCRKDEHMATGIRGNLLFGTLGALLAAVLAAIAWAAITASTGFQIGYMAVGVGFLAGYAMRVLGGGRDAADGIIAGAVALAGCVLGNLLAGAAIVANHLHYPVIAVELNVLLRPATAMMILKDGFNVMDLLFYAIGGYTGHRTALKPALKSEVPRLL